MENNVMKELVGLSVSIGAIGIIGALVLNATITDPSVATFPSSDYGYMIMTWVRHIFFMGA